MGSIISLDIRFERSVDQARSIILVREGILKQREIYYDFHGPHLPAAPVRGDFAVLALLPYAMHEGKALHCNAPVARDFVESLEECMALWSRWRPDLFRPVAISADKEIETKPPQGRRAMLAYSGGVDATFALHAHKTGMMGRRQLDIQSALLVHGLFELKLHHPDRLKAASESARAILQHYGLDLTTVATNWYDVCVEYGMTFSFGFYSALHHFVDAYDYGIFASEEPYECEAVPWASHSTANRLDEKNTDDRLSAGSRGSRAGSNGCIVPSAGRERNDQARFREGKDCQSTGSAALALTQHLSQFSTQHLSI